MERVSTVLRVITACLALLLLQACASGPKFDQVAAAHLPPAPGLGRIFIYRSTIFGGAIEPSVVVNGETVGNAVAKGFFFIDRPPGDYTIATTTEVERSLTLTLDAGQIRYVHLGVTEGFAVVHVYPRLVDPAEGAKGVAALHYTGGSAASPAAAAPPLAAPTPHAPPQTVQIDTLPPPAPLPAPVPGAPPPAPTVPVAHSSPMAVPVATVPRTIASRVPYLDDTHQAKFQEYLTKPKPHAFAISDNGHFASIWGPATGDPTLPKDAANRALQSCRTAAGKECVLYAVDDQIVFGVE